MKDKNLGVWVKRYFSKNLIFSEIKIKKDFLEFFIALREIENSG